MRFLMVGAGGFVGSVLRYWLSTLIQAQTPRTVFPLGTVGVNIIGCAVMGALIAGAEVRGLSDGLRLFLAVGLLGGFTTFSAFAGETLAVARLGRPGLAVGNVAASMILCLLAVWAGHTLTTRFLR